LQEFSKLRITVHGSSGFTDFLLETASEMVAERVENCDTDFMAHTLNKWTCLCGLVAVFMTGRLYFSIDLQTMLWVSCNLSVYVITNLAEQPVNYPVD